MAGFRIDTFRGLRPRISAKKLHPGEAVIAENLKLGSNDLEPIPDKSTEQAVGTGRSSRTIYKFDNGGSPIWFEWDDYVDVARGPVKDDSLERTYYTGDTFGNGAPKMTTTELADEGGGGPYPEDWLYIGVPAPVTAPTVSPTDLPEDVTPGNRLAEEMTVDSLFIDQVKWTVYPGTGTRDTVWNLNSAATGAITFDIQPGTSFRVASVVSKNKVTLESATEPGISMRTRNSDKTTVNDWHPMDNNGSTQEADFLGWRVPEGMEARIIDHKLNVGDVIVVSALNRHIEFWAALTTDFTEVGWSIESQLDDGGTPFYHVLDAEVSGETYSGEGHWRLTGSFYYDVDRSSSDASELEDRSYVYTYVNEFGEEGPPSPASTATPLLDGQSVLISGLDLPPTIGYNINLVRLYRTNSTEAGTEYQFVKEFSVARTTRDDVLSKNLGEVISTTSWDPPDPDMVGIIALPNGILVGFNGKQLYFSEPYFPHAWPAEYDQAVEYDIVGIAAFGNSVAVMTKGWPYIATGSHPRNMNVRAVKINQACLSKEGIASDGDRVYYPSPDGLVEVSVNGIGVKTDKWLDPKDWQAYLPATIVGEFYEGRYYGFWDFDVTSVDPVITAELSGTITDADEADIVNGAKTILITLTNDTWVAAGASFNNQRAAIIAGLVCTTDQTLGWNNVAGAGIGVGDVVRTSDTVCTITMPATPGYAITSEERVDSTIPAAALLLSNDAIIAGSHFRIVPQEAVATVTLTGTLGGNTEASVVTGGETIIITLTNDTWQTTLTDAMKQLIIDGIVSSTNEIDGWNDHVPQLITASTDVVRTSDTVVTVTLPAVPLYSVTENESISAIVPYQSLTLQENEDSASGNTLAILATGVASAVFSGTVTESATENEIVAGAKTLIITLTNDTWIAAGTGPIGTTAQTQSIIDALIASTSQTLGWNNVVVPGIETADLVRTSATVATITLDAESTYSIADNETVGATIPADVFTGAEVIAVSNTFGIQAQTPVTCALTGTITTADEVDIVTGGKTIILTLSDDTWLAAGTGPIGSTANSQAIIDGLTAATTPTNGWNNEIRDGSLGPTDIVRTSDTVATITVGADAQYDIAADETITATVPAAALNISASAVVASPTFDITFNVPATVAVSGTADNATNAEIIAGGKTIILTVSNDEWVAAGATFNAIRQDIIDGLDAASSPTYGWNNEVRDVMGVGSVVRTSSTVVTITLPATAEYDINANESITVTVPASALTEEVSPVVATPAVDITANSTATSRISVGFRDLYDYPVSGDNDAQVATSFFDPDHHHDFGNFDAPSSDTLQDLSWAGDGAALVISVTAGANTEVWRSTDRGESFTLADTFTGLNSLSYINWIDEPDGGKFMASITDPSNHEFHYSSDGSTWTDITSAVTATETLSSSVAANRFLYGGNRVYLWATNNSAVERLIPSADLSTASTVSSNWGTGIAPGGGNTTFGEIGTGNGKFLHVEGAHGANKFLYYMAHGGSSFTIAGTGILPSSSSKPAPGMSAFGNDHWMFTTGSYIWYCDISGGATDDENVTNWVYQSGFTGISGLTIVDLIYDDDFGFLVVGYRGTGASRVTEVWSAATPDATWVEEFEVEAVAEAVFDCLTSINEINGASLD